MGLTDSVRELYFRYEEKYYGFLDRVNEHVPVYGIVDPIDRVIPSCILFSTIFLVILAFLFAWAFGIVSPISNNSLAINVQDAAGNGIDAVTISFTKDGKTIGSVQTDEFGTAKLFDIKEGEQYEVLAEKDGYLSVNRTVIISEIPQAEDIEFEEEGGAYTTRTIRLVDSLNQQVSDNFTLTFHCSNPYATDIADIDLAPSDRGVANVEVPNNCDRLTVDVSNSNRHAEITNETVTGNDHTIYLEEETGARGTLAVSVADSQGRPLDGIQVNVYKYSELLDNPNVGPIDGSYTSAAGSATFSVSAGQYIAKAYDSAASFTPQSSQVITVGANESKSASIVLSAQAIGSIKFKVTEKRNGNTVSGAKITLFYAQDNSEAGTATTGADGTAQIAVSRPAGYNAIVSATTFQPSRLSSLGVSDSTNNVALEKCTATTCGLLRVKVVDKDSQDAITGATVVLYNAANNFVAGYANRTTDINGVAKFSGVAAGNYYAFAFREGFSGRGDAAYFAGGQTDNGNENLKVEMQVPLGVVSFAVTDADGDPVPFVAIGLFDARNNQKIGSEISDANGTKSFTIKADKRVYAVLTKNDEQVYAQYTTSKKAVIPDGTQAYNVTLERPILKDNVEIIFAGIFDESGKQSQNVKAGEIYTAKFKLRVPEEKDYDSVGVHIRTGDDVLMEKDELVIKHVNSPPRSSQVKATRYEDNSNLDEEDYDVTAGDAKWVNAKWFAAAGVYEIEAELQIKESASIGDKLSLYYRAWGELENGSMDRFPVDNTVTKEIYSNTKQEILQIGVVTLCDEDFCFTATVHDKDKDFLDSVTDTYNARVFSGYKLQFAITNNSKSRIHNSANLRVVNSDKTLKFFAYTMTDAATAQKQGFLNGFEFPRQDAGDLRPKGSIRLETDFTPQHSGVGIINIQLVSDQQIVFEKSVTVTISSPNQLDVSIEPNVFLSGVQNDITVTVLDASDGLEVENATVRVKDRRLNVLDFAQTGKDGKAVVTLPGQKPGEKLFIEVEKKDYDVKKIEITVSDDLLLITPAAIGVSLNTKNKPQSEDKILVKNTAPYDLEVKSIGLSGNFRKLLDSAKVRNWLESSYKGMTISSKGSSEIVLKTFLSEDAKNLTKRQDIEAQLVIVATQFGQEWVFKVPVKIAIGLGDEVDNPACLVVTKSEWIVSTSGTPKRTEFEIQNNCTVGGKSVALQNLEARVLWKTNQLGEYTLDIGADSTTLRTGYFRLLLGTLKAEQTLTSILSFTPFGGVNGSGEATIEVRASNPLDSDDQLLVNSIKSKVTSINLDECITYDKERLVMNQGETGTVTITASETCGEAVHFDIESDLKTTPTSEFNLQPGQSQAVAVLAEKNNPGQYALYVSPKFGSDRKEQLAKNVRVVINAPGCWQMSKYEFDVFDGEDELDGFDYTNLTNNCVEKPVQVTVNTKDWLQAAQNGLFWGLASMGMVMLTNAADPNTTWLGNPEVGDPIAQATVGKNTYYQDAYGKWSLNDKPVDNPALITQLEQNKRALDADQPKPAGVTSLPTPQNGQQQVSSQRQASQDIPPGGTITPDPAVTSRDISDVPPGGTINPIETVQSSNLYGVTITSSPSVPIPSGQYQVSTLGEIYDSAGNKRYYRKTGTTEWYDVSTSSQLNTTMSTALENISQAVINANTPTGNVILPIANSAQPFPPLADLVTGYAVTGAQGQGGAGNALGAGIAQSVGGGLGGGLLQGGAGLVRGLLGTSPWAGGILGFVAGTAISYMSQQESATFTIIADDVEFKDVSLVQGSLEREQQDKDVSVKVEGLGDDEFEAPTSPQPLVANKDLISQGTETLRAIFTNISGFTTTQARPHYSELKITGIRHEYEDKVYDKDDFIDDKGGFLGFFETPTVNKDKSKLTEKDSKPLEERFHLEFNSVPPQIETNQPLGVLNCQDGTRVGKTGTDALPKIKLAWNWRDIGASTCDEDNPDGKYCDATQFSIALLQKIKQLNDYVSQNGPSFACPSPLEDAKETNDIGSFDIGVSSLVAAKDGTKVDVIATIKNTNPGQILTSSTITLVSQQGSVQVNCPSGAQSLTVGAGAEDEVKCTFTNVAEGFYFAKVAMTPSVSCENCQDVSATNSLQKTVFVGSSGLAQCEPYSTSRLDEFLLASGIKNERMSNLAKFNAKLMVDGYSSDFQRDFDVAQAQTFFSAPDYYTNQKDGLGVYMRDTNLFTFDAYSQPDFTLPGPGTYSITLDITYDDKQWQLFDAAGNPKAHVVVRMEKLKGAEPDSPFYYLPIDGLVGKDGRVGYGINFSGDPVVLDNSPSAVRTVEIAGSAPIENGVLQVTKGDSFKSMQIDERGVVVKLSRANENPQLLFQPSNATPVILEIEKNSGRDAYAIYQPAVDGDAVDVGTQLTLWNGIGSSCRAFDDSVMSQQQFVPDTHGISARCALIGPDARSKYALEFCATPINYGTASYETVFYTPQGSQSFVRLTDVASDNARFITSASSGPQVPLNGNGTTAQINSLQDVFNLVEGEYMCITGTNLNSEFFWNPKKLFETIEQKQEDAINSCITAQQNE